MSDLSLKRRLARFASGLDQAAPPLAPSEVTSRISPNPTRRRWMAVTAVAAVAVLVVGAVVAVRVGSSGEGPAWVVGAPREDPSFEELSGPLPEPPRLTIRTKTSSVVPATGPYCWEATCLDVVVDRERGVPSLTVDEGDVVYLDFDQVPTHLEAVLTIQADGREAGDTLQVETSDGRRPEFVVEGARQRRLLTLHAYWAQRGSAQYLVWLEPET